MIFFFVTLFNLKRKEAHHRKIIIFLTKYMAHLEYLKFGFVCVCVCCVYIQYYYLRFNIIYIVLNDENVREWNFSYSKNEALSSVTVNPFPFTVYFSSFFFSFFFLSSLCASVFFFFFFCQFHSFISISGVCSFCVPSKRKLQTMFWIHYSGVTKTKKKKKTLCSSFFSFISMFFIIHLCLFLIGVETDSTCVTRSTNQNPFFFWLWK